MSERDVRLQLISAQSEIASLKLQVEQLKRGQVYQHELSEMVSSKALVTGPVNPDSLQLFNSETIISEMLVIMPKLYGLFNELADSQRNCHGNSDSNVRVEQLKAIMSLLVLLNARSNHANGVQLLISMMLIGRSTNKQVSCMKFQYSLLSIHIMLYSFLMHAIRLSLC